MKLRGSLLFHLNLSYSSIEVEERSEVIRRCYWPILRLLDERPWLRICIEASAHTLERIAELDPMWITRLRSELDAGRVEFIGSGETQLIGPLVPAAVNAWNQKLGVEGYESRLGARPHTALVNEMAWSQGLIDHYLDADYRTLLMEWNNPRRTHPEWEDEWRFGLVNSCSPRGREIEVLFVDAIAFQKFQRAANGDLTADEYCDWVESQDSANARHLFLYASDAEVFNYRPGRYSSEPPLADDDVSCEWARIGCVLDGLHERGLEFTTPALHRTLDGAEPRATVELTSFANPIPVKKQPKYNVTRWALSGRDDVGLNAMCFARAEALLASGNEDAEDWRELCRVWRSDFRTHLTRKRWQAVDRLNSDPSSNGLVKRALATPEVVRDGRYLRVTTAGLALELDTNRGLAITKLAVTGGANLIGTLPHGTFDDIHWAADFYSGHLVAEVPAHLRVTDLSRVQPRVTEREDHIEIGATVETEIGALEKVVRVFADHAEVEFGVSAWNKRPVGSVRAGFVTFDPQTFGGADVRLSCENGGERESFCVAGDCDQWSAVSALISASGAFGATTGSLTVESEAAGLELSWDPGAVAALPLVFRREIGEQVLFRIGFSMSEIDDTHRHGAPAYDFALTLRPLARD